MSLPTLTGKSALAVLKSLDDLASVAKMLGYKPASLSYIIYKVSAERKYSAFSIRKRSGGVRNIYAPYPPLKTLQKRLADVLSAALEEIESPHPHKRSLAHGFRANHSIATNALVHVRARHVLNVDLAEFFPSFNFGRVRGFFLSSKHFKMKPAAATIIAQIACYNNQLPQGAPTSPVVTNLICRWLDRALVRLAKQAGCRYSRYADDITFSTNQKEFPAGLAKWTGTRWIAGPALVSTLLRFGFSINPEKTRLSSRKGRQTVTGLTVNRHPNIRQTYYRDVRAMVWRLTNTGTYALPEHGLYPRDRKKQRAKRFVNWLAARAPNIFRIASLIDILSRYIIGLFRRLNPQVTRKNPIIIRMVSDVITEPNLDVLQGKISFIYNIKKFSGKIQEFKGISKVYMHFLLYRYFYAPDKALIVCEGKTDNVYLRTAINRLHASYPDLVEDSRGQKKLKVRFYRHYGLQSEIIGMRGGEGDIKKFLSAYQKRVGKFRAPGQLHPVIFVVDNDDGGQSIYKMVENIFGKKINCITGAGITHLIYNMYLLSTDPMGVDGKSCIENNFDAVTLGTVLEGRVFKYDGETNKATEYGKNEFAERVVLKQQATIDFSGFKPLLDRIVEVLKHHQANVPTASARIVPAVGKRAA